MTRSVPERADRNNPAPPASRVYRAPVVVVPNAVLLDRTLSDRAVRLYVLLGYVGDRQTLPPTRDALAQMLGCSRPSLDRAVVELRAGGYLHTERAAAGDVNRYELRVPR